MIHSYNFFLFQPNGLVACCHARWQFGNSKYCILQTKEVTELETLQKDLFLGHTQPPLEKTSEDLAIFSLEFDHVTVKSIAFFCLSSGVHTLAVGEQFCCSQPSLPHVWHVKLPLKGVLNTPAWYVSYAMLMRPKRPKQLSMAANWPGEMVVRMRDVLATPGWC